MAMRLRLWQKLAGAWKLASLDDLATECSLEGLEIEIERILQGRQRGRVVVNLM